MHLPLMSNDHGAGGYATGNLSAWGYMQYLGMDTSNQDLGNRKEVIAIPAIATWGR